MTIVNRVAGILNLTDGTEMDCLWISLDDSWVHVIDQDQEIRQSIPVGLVESVFWMHGHGPEPDDTASPG